MTQPDEDDPMAVVRPYLAMASGILGISAAKAAEMAQGLWTQGGDVVDGGVRTATETGEQVAALLSPEQVRALVRDEVERIVRRLGFARDDEVASLRREVGRLEQQVAALGADLDARVAQVATATSGKPAKKTQKAHKSKGKKHRADEGAS
jgi:polyhydroxyalkanoate synthesis regulator phasin